MPQLGYTQGPNLKPEVMDYLLKKKDPSYQAQMQKSRAQTLLEQMQQVREREANPEYQARLAASQEPSIDPGFAGALAKLSSQAGTLGGKAADTSAVDDFSNAMERQRQQRVAQGDQRRKASDVYDESRLKTALAQDDDDRSQAKLFADNASKERDYGLKKRELDLKEKELAGGVYAGHVDGTDAQGNPVVNVLDKHGKVLNTIAGKPASKSNQDYKQLPMEAQEEVKGLSTKVANQVSIANSIDSQLKNMNDAYSRGDKSQAVIAGKQMIKTLNSDEGKDAVGAEEARRLGSLLEYQVFNLTQPGPMFGRDVKGFFEQAASKSNSIKNSITANRQRIQDIYGGKYNQPMAETSTKIHGFGSTKPDPSQAQAAPMPAGAGGYQEGSVETLGGVPYKLTNGNWVEVQ